MHVPRQIISGANKGGGANVRIKLNANSLKSLFREEGLFLDTLSSVLITTKEFQFSSLRIVQNFSFRLRSPVLVNAGLVALAPARRRVKTNVSERVGTVRAGPLITHSKENKENGN